MPLGSLGQPRGAFWGSLGRPWGAFWGPWATLGGPLGPLWAPKGRPSHMGQKRNRHKNTHLGRCWLQNGSPGYQHEVTKLYFFDLNGSSKLNHFLGTYFSRTSEHFSMCFRTFVDGKTVQRHRTRKSATSRIDLHLQYFLYIFLIIETDRVERNYNT